MEQGELPRDGVLPRIWNTRYIDCMDYLYYIVQFALLIFFFIYLVVLCAVYTGTMNKIFTSYGIAILELIILKLIYGLILGILRYYSIENQKSSMYNFVLFMDTYLV